MNSAPSTEQVYQGVYAFYNNSNTLEQQKASQWLNELQKSVRYSFILPQLPIANFLTSKSCKASKFSLCLRRMVLERKVSLNFRPFLPKLAPGEQFVGIESNMPIKKIPWK